MKKIDKEPFSNGTEFMLFEYECCNKCIKASLPRKDGGFTNADDNNNPNKCAIQRDIVIRMYCNDPINERTVKVCYDFVMHGKLCPYMKTKRNKYIKKNKNQLEISL